MQWYECALNMTDYDEGGEFDGMQDEPRYLLLARTAEMYQEGSFGLTADPQRAGMNGNVKCFSSRVFAVAEMNVHPNKFATGLGKDINTHSAIALLYSCVWNMSTAILECNYTKICACSLPI